jgi:sugar O-acyltransferase (sialic acid O-acetyltransferase NeuD family)
MPTQHPPLAVTIPLLNPNETEAILVSLNIRNGQKVAAGDTLGVLETTKSTGEVISEGEGYVSGLRLTRGQAACAGDLLCYLLENPDEMEIEASDASVNPVKPRQASQPEAPLPVGLRITQPALAVARQEEMDLSSLPIGPMVTVGMVRDILSRQKILSELAGPGLKPEGPVGMLFDPAALVIYGGGGHGKSLIELVRLLKVYHLAGVVDDGLPVGSEVLGVPVLGGMEVLSDLYRRGVHLAVNAVGGIGNLGSRLKVFDNLAQAGFSCPAVVHPTAFVEASARLASGVQVFPHAYIGSSVQVGFGSIINTGAIVSHDCSLEEAVNLSPGAILAGAVQVGARTLIGMGVTVNLEVKVGTGVRIGNGATIKADVPAGTIVKAGSTWPA